MNINKLIILLITLITFASSSFSQNQKVKIKGDKSVSYYYSSDSSCVDKINSKAIVISFHSLYKSVETDNYNAFLDCLSPMTKKLIPAEKLQKKFTKFKNYSVKLFGKIQVISIQPFTGHNNEEKPVYICTIKLPEGQTIGHRVGFDALKTKKDPEASHWFGLHLVETDLGYKSVILF